MSKRRGGHGGGHSSSERWLLTYADMITLLLVFFIVLYSMASPEAHKFDELQKSLTSAFHVTSGASTAILTGSVNPIQGGSAIIPEMEALMKQQEKIEKDIAQKNGQDAAKMVTTSLNQRGLVISLANSAFFAPGDAAILPQAQAVLATIAGDLAKNGRNIMIEGHTDNTPINTYRYPSNWELSTARATAVVRYLITQAGIQPRRLSAAGYGEYYPLVANTTPENRAKNRRVDIVILRSDLKGQRPGGQF
jgi:chemotaxis protein MotB